MTIRLLIVDDEQLAIDRLVEYCRDIEGVEVVGSARDSAEAEAAIAALAPDLITLDIQMPGRSGMALAAALPIEDRPEIIFITAFEHYAPDAFEVEAADYLLKPVRFDRLRQAIRRAERRRDERKAASRAGLATELSPYQDAVWVSVKGATLRLPVSAIDWIEAARDYVLLHTATRSYIYRSSMSALEAAIDPAELLRVHRSNFVRLSLVDSVERLGKGLIALQLRDGAIISVGPNYTQDVLRYLGLPH
ncbi:MULTISPECIES: LytTR family DNA-binding domain-containing protein [unclassified Sphingopyxis]|uniref:LytR/AlgR family response regulator transcription factor n=1 Tax=unclassified Sphingopyxis TaxID=2614943 RepID=UPI0024AD2791|nr:MULTISPECIES: LytTR family DNA-binding domain-containing protein [unclassified Sphingopyxis]